MYPALLCHHDRADMLAHSHSIVQARSRQNRNLLLTKVAAEAPGKTAAEALRRTATEDSFMVMSKCGGDVLDDVVNDARSKL